LSLKWKKLHKAIVSFGWYTLNNLKEEYESSVVTKENNPGDAFSSSVQKNKNFYYEIKNQEKNPF